MDQSLYQQELNDKDHFFFVNHNSIDFIAIKFWLNYVLVIRRHIIIV